MSTVEVHNWFSNRKSSRGRICRNIQWIFTHPGSQIRKIEFCDIFSFRLRRYFRTWPRTSRQPWQSARRMAHPSPFLVAWPGRWSRRRLKLWASWRVSLVGRRGPMRTTTAALSPNQGFIRSTLDTNKLVPPPCQLLGRRQSTRPWRLWRRRRTKAVLRGVSDNFPSSFLPEPNCPPVTNSFSSNFPRLLNFMLYG